MLSLMEEIIVAQIEKNTYIGDIDRDKDAVE